LFVSQKNNTPITGMSFVSYFLYERFGHNLRT
jgi:hypothetical protein